VARPLAVGHVPEVGRDLARLDHSVAIEIEGSTGRGALLARETIHVVRGPHVELGQALIPGMIET
jgi:hypothetical protein